MKKMLSTILVAVAFAAISTVDAKQMVQRGQKSMSESASNLLDVSKAAMNGQASGQELLDALKQEPQTPEEQKTVALIAEIKDLENKKAAIQDQMSQQKWFGFFRNTTEEKEANNKLKESLNAINGQLRLRLEQECLELVRLQEEYMNLVKVTHAVLMKDYQACVVQHQR